MATLASLIVRLTADAGDFEQRMTQTQRTVQRVGQSMDQVGRRMTTRVTLPMAALGGVAIDAASDLEESMSKARVVFGDAAAEVEAFADTSAEALGISEDAALDAVATFGNLFDALEINRDASLEMSTGLTQLAADLASFNNLDPTETLTALRSGIVGEVEPLRRLGINLSQATVQAYALEQGIAATTDELTQADLVTARYALIMEQSANAQGDFARTADGLANSTRIAKAQLRDAAATLGTNLLPMATDALHSVNDLVAGFNELSPAGQRWIVTVGGIAAATGPALMVTGRMVQSVSTLAPVVSQLPRVLSDARAGFQLYRAGASTAEVASLGLSASLVPLAAGFAAVAAVAAAAYTAIEFGSDVQEQQADLSERWARFLQQQAEEQATAIAVAEQYADAQAMANEEIDNAAWYAQVFINRQRATTASTQEVHLALIEGAASYRDYAMAVAMVNENGSHNIDVMSDVQWILERLAASGAVNAEAHEWAARAAAEQGDSLETTTDTIEDTGAAIGALTGALRAQGVESSRVADLERTLNLQMGETTQLAQVQGDALSLLAMALDDGIIAQDDYISAGLAVQSIQADNIDGYLAVRDAVDSATGGYYGLRDATGSVAGSIRGITTVAQEAAAQAAELAAQQEQAWQSFSQSVETGVAGALEAYRSGNDEMLAEQQTALAEMLWSQTDSMLGMGQITREQAMEMRSAIAGEFGIVVDEVDLAQQQILSLFGDWSSGGETSAQEIVGFIENIGTETDELVAQQEEAIALAIEAWETGSQDMSVVSDDITRYWELVGLAADESNTLATEGMETVTVTAGSMAEGIATHGGEVTTSFSEMETALSEKSAMIVQYLNDISAAANSIPNNIDLGVHVTAQMPEEFTLNSPQFRFHTALENLIAYAGRHQVPVNVAGRGGAPNQSIAGIVPTGAMGTMTAGGGGAVWNGNLVIDGSRDPDATARAAIRALEDRGIIPRTRLR